MLCRHPDPPITTGVFNPGPAPLDLRVRPSTGFSNGDVFRSASASQADAAQTLEKAGYSVSDISAAFPPAAAVLTVTVCLGRERVR